MDGRKLETQEPSTLSRNTQSPSVTFGQAPARSSHSSVVSSCLNEVSGEQQAPGAHRKHVTSNSAAGQRGFFLAFASTRPGTLQRMKNPSAPLAALLSFGLINLSSAAALAQVRLQVEPYRSSPSDSKPEPEEKEAEEPNPYVFQYEEPDEIKPPPPMEKRRRRTAPRPIQTLPRSLHVDAPTP